MSDHIPFEIQVQIIKSLPIKSLIRFRSISKTWKSLIDSSDFIADYTDAYHLLIRYKTQSSSQVTYVSIVDDDSFPQNKVSPTLPPSVNLLRRSIFVGASRGLVCLFGYRSGTPMAVIWNPSIRKSVAIVVPDVGWDTVFGFGVCPATSDPKIVKISNTITHTKWQIEVYGLSSGVWRSSSDNLSGNSVVAIRPHSQVTIDGFIYWFGTRNGFYLLLSFDLSSEEFREINLPNELAFHYSQELHLCKRIDSLAVIHEWNHIYEVWIMENGDTQSFTKLFTFSKSQYLSRPLEFRRNGELMMRMTDDTDHSEALMVYEPFSGHINDLGIKGQFVSSYTESLILLDRSSDTLVDDKDDEEMSV